MATRLIIYEDNRDLRYALSEVLRVNPEVELVADFSNCIDVQHHMEVYRPEVILMDIDMPEVDGITGTLIIKSGFPNIFVIMLTVFEDPDKIIKAICAGADGYLLKKSTPDEIYKAIQDVKEGGAPMTPLVAKKVIQKFPKSQPVNLADTFSLSPREAEILNCLIDGNSYKQVAANLEISIDTVRSHIKKIYQKLQVQSATEAVAKALHVKGNG